MDKCFILIVTDKDQGSEIFHHTTPGLTFLQTFDRLLCPQSNAVIYIIVPNYNILCEFRDEFDGANYIFLDVGKDIETDKQILTNLPEIDCIIDFTGKLDSSILCWIQELQSQIVSKVSLKCKDFHLSKLDQLLKPSTSKPMLITVLPSKENKNFAKSLKKKGEAKLKDLFKSDNNITKKQEAMIQFQPSQKFNSNQSYCDQQPSNLSSSLARAERVLSRLERNATGTGERQPLLGSSGDGQESIDITFSNFTSCFRYYCSCCFSICNSFSLSQQSQPLHFRNEAHLNSYVRGEQHTYTRRKLNNVFDEGKTTWTRIMQRFDDQQKAEGEIVREKYDQQKQERMNKYHKIVAANIEKAPTQEILIKSAAHREHAELDKLKWIEQNLAKDLEGLKLKYDGFKESEGVEQFYGEMMKEQFRVLRRAKNKYTELLDEIV